MNDITKGLFLGPFSDAIVNVGGTFDPGDPGGLSVPDGRWDAFLTILQLKLGRNWQIEQEPSDPYPSQRAYAKCLVHTSEPVETVTLTPTPVGDRVMISLDPQLT